MCQSQEKDINLAKLASILNTNTKYVSLIISNHRAKKTTTYINDLKIDYVVDLLINHKKFRNYTNKALAEEAGFGSTQIFTQSFKSKVGMSPTSFIKQLKKSNENNSEED
jgi:AraC-like DNA-binding protein